jgi:signal transduction histidine kinase
VTAELLVSILQYASAGAFALIGALTVRDWLASRDRAGGYLALAIGSLAVVSLLGQAGRIFGSGFTAVSSYVTVVIFLGSGLALLLFRDSVIPLARRTRSLVIAAVAATAVMEIGVQAAWGKAAPRPLQYLALAAFVVVWSGCVFEPSVRLWLAAGQRTAVQRARMRALSLGYLGIIAILVAAVFTASLPSHPAIKIGFALASIAIVPLLYAGFTPPTWLRRAWRQGEETKFQQATGDIIRFSTDRPALAARVIDWAVRLSGADAGFFAADRSTILATHGMTVDEARQVQEAVATAGKRVTALGGSPPRSAIVAEIVGSEATIVLVGGPFTPVFGSDEQAWIQQYAALVSTGLDRVRLVEAVDKVNAELQTKIREVSERTLQLEAANRELEAFSYTISHDLRAPLRAISGFTQILMDEYADALNDQARNYLTRVRDNGVHMGQLVDDLLAFSRLGRQALRTQPLNTRSVLDRALAQLAPAMEGRQVDLVIGELPECEADANLLEQVFVNLLSNALKYSQKRARARIEVRATGGSPAEDVVFSVRDNGAGFDMAYADKLFGVFQRLHRSSEYEGTGVGLAIVHRIVARHGGRIWAEAKVDEGATFYFTVKGAQEWQLPTAA